MFDTVVFKERLAKQLSDFEMVVSGQWQIAPSVFVARVRSKGESTWTFVFYYDQSQTAFRDSRHMDRTVQLLMAGFEQGALSEDQADTLKIFHLGGGLLGECPIGTPDNAINYASQILTSGDKSEIPWFDVPQTV